VAYFQATAFFVYGLTNNTGYITPMPGTITALKVQKNNKERVSVFLDDSYAFSTTLNAALHLKRGQVLSDDQIADLEGQGNFGLAYDKALRYLSYRQRSQQEIQTYLSQKDIPPAIIETVMARLQAQNYVDDLAFAQAWIRNRSQINPKGEHALRQELRQKGVSETDIDTALADLNEEEAAWQAASKRLKRWEKLDDTAFRQKLTAYLARRGFSYDIITAIYHKVRP
jgi:regulatory protein